MQTSPLTEIRFFGSTRIVCQNTFCAIPAKKKKVKKEVAKDKK